VSYSQLSRPIFLIFAAANEAKQGITGAAIGTETICDMLSERYHIEWLRLRSNGLGQLAVRCRGAQLIAYLKAASISLGALSRLAWRGLKKPQVEIVYMLPAASTMGIIRNAGTVLVVRLFHRKALLVFHIRNGNYFDRMSSWKERLNRFANSRADRILVLSRLLLPDDLSHAGVREAQLSILPNTIDETVLPASLPTRPVPPPLRVLYLSNFIAEKGYLALLDAAERLADRGQTERFVLTFHGKWLSEGDRHAAEARAAMLNRRGMTVHLGDCLHDRREVREVYGSHHVFCLPTLYSAEAQPRSVLEAMANGCAVLATNYRGIPEQVVDGQTGFLVASQDPDVLADQLITLMNSNPEDMGRSGRVHFDDHFSRASVKQHLLQILEGGTDK